MSTNPMGGRIPMQGLALTYPQSLAVYADYQQAQKAVDHLADNDFPVQNVMIVGTDLKQVERVTGRLTQQKVALGGLLSGLWMGLFVGLIFSMFEGQGMTVVVTTMLFGAIFGIIWALIGYAMTRGRRDFTSVQQVVATKYEVLVEHNLHAQAAQLLTGMPGGRPGWGQNAPAGNGPAPTDPQQNVAPPAPPAPPTGQPYPNPPAPTEQVPQQSGQPSSPYVAPGAPPSTGSAQPTTGPAAGSGGAHRADPVDSTAGDERTGA